MILLERPVEILSVFPNPAKEALEVRKAQTIRNNMWDIFPVTNSMTMSYRANPEVSLSHLGIGDNFLFRRIRKIILAQSKQIPKKEANWILKLPGEWESPPVESTTEESDTHGHARRQLRHFRIRRGPRTFNQEYFEAAIGNAKRALSEGIISDREFNAIRRDLRIQAYLVDTHVQDFEYHPLAEGYVPESSYRSKYEKSEREYNEEIWYETDIPEDLLFTPFNFMFIRSAVLGRTYLQPDVRDKMMHSLGTFLLQKFNLTGSSVTCIITDSNGAQEYRIAPEKVFFNQKREDGKLALTSAYGAVDSAISRLNRPMHNIPIVFLESEIPISDRRYFEYNFEGLLKNSIDKFGLLIFTELGVKSKYIEELVDFHMRSYGPKILHLTLMPGTTHQGLHHMIDHIVTCLSPD